MTEGNKEESDQLPEEAPQDQVADDSGGGGDARGQAQENPGTPGENEQGTGNPDAAGSSDPDEGESGE